MYLIGRTGTGKSTLLETLMRHDLTRGNGFALIDPHGDLADKVARSASAHASDRFIYLDAGNETAALGFNPLSDVPPAKRPLAVSGLMEVFKKTWSDSWGPRLEYILRNCLAVLLDAPGSTLADIQRLFIDPAFRRRVVAQTSNREVYAFWAKEYEAYPARLQAEAIAPVQNKVGAFLINPVLRRILTSPGKQLDFRATIDQGKLLIANLAKGRVGEDTSALIGALLLNRLSLAAFQRAEVPVHERRDFFIFLDEFPIYAGQQLGSLLSELRKYRVGLILAHQFLTQLEIPLRDAILGNAGTLISFRIGAADAEILEQEFYPTFNRSDLVNLPNYNFYIKLMIDGGISEPFSAETISPAD